MTGRIGLTQNITAIKFEQQMLDLLDPKIRKGANNYHTTETIPKLLNIKVFLQIYNIALS